MTLSKINADLFQAVMDEDPLKLEQLISMGAELNTLDATGRTPLMWATVSGNSEIVKILLRYGADPNARTADGNTALKIAAFSGYAAIVAKLIDADAYVESSDNNGETALMDAAKEAHIEIINQLVDAGAQVNSQDAKGYTALIWSAIRTDSQEAANKLLSSGADPSIKTLTGETALDMALKMGHAQFASALTK